MAPALAQQLLLVTLAIASLWALDDGLAFLEDAPVSSAVSTRPGFPPSLKPGCLMEDDQTNLWCPGDDGYGCYKIPTLAHAVSEKALAAAKERGGGSGSDEGRGSDKDEEETQEEEGQRRDGEAASGAGGEVRGRCVRRKAAGGLGTARV